MESNQLQSVVKAKSVPNSQVEQQLPPANTGDYATIIGGPSHNFNNVSLHAPVSMQPGLNINQPGDEYEQEADRIAEQVTQLPATRLQPPANIAPAKKADNTLMRKLIVNNPQQLIPNPTGQGLRQTNAATIESYLQTISPSGGLTVNRTSGEVSMSTGYCPGVLGGMLQGARVGYDIGNTIGSIGGVLPPWLLVGPVLGAVGGLIGGLVGAVAGLFGATSPSAAAASATPAGSTCLCEFVGSGRETRVEIQDGVSPAGSAALVRVHSPNDQRQWGTATVSGQLTNTPPWLEFAHELCGHAWAETHPVSGEDEEGPEGTRAPLVGRDSAGQLEIQEYEGMGTGPRREARADQYLRHGRTVELENRIRAEHGIEARGYRLRDPYCGESYWRDRSTPGGAPNWQQTGERPGETYLQQCEYLRSQLPENRDGRYRIDERIPEQPATGVIQRQCSCGGECPKCKAQHATNEVPSTVFESLHTPGQPLDTTTRTYFESRFGHDFSRVRVHNDAKANAAAQSVAAAAYTVGADITFAAGRFQPASESGKQLLAHELTHVVQQQHAPAVPQAARLQLSTPADAAEEEATRIAGAVGKPGALQPVRERPATSLARAPLDVESIAKDTNTLADKTVPIGQYPVQMAVLFFKYGWGHVEGDIAMAADYPTTFKMPVDKTKRATSIPKADTTVPLSNIPVVAHFFPTPFPVKERALVIGGFHGDEYPGWQATEKLVDDLSKNKGPMPAFNTIVIPRLNAGAIADELSGVRLWRNRCNRQLVDLNRDFPTGNTPKDTDCANTEKAPRQPETLALIKLIQQFKPNRILSVHAISDAASAGVFADPGANKEAVAIARGMAGTLVNPSDRQANALGTGPKDFNAVYPLDRGKKEASAGTSLGAWGPTAIPGQTTPVITMEAPEFKSLGTGPGTAPRTVEGFVRPLHAFLSDPAGLAPADRDILADIDALNAADRVAFLTGLTPSKDDIFRRIQFRVDTAIANLNAMKPPVKLKKESSLRLFTEDTAKDSAQAKIDFDKFFLRGGKTNGWDTLPDTFFKKGDRKKGVDRDKWLATPSKDRLDIILRFSSLPGTSRHHWGTEIDFNSTEVKDWEPAVPATAGNPGKKEGTLFQLGQWLQQNAPKVGLIQSYTAGRKGGYSEEPWHYSYAPISKELRERYNAEVNLQKDVIDKIVADFTQRAKAAGQTLPADFAAALKQINISDLVNKIGPGL